MTYPLKDQLRNQLNTIFKQIHKKKYRLKFKEIKFLCYNPHCSEDDTLGKEDKIISMTIKNFNNVTGPYAADSAFRRVNKNILFISMYHDQALIPFKILNKKGINFTMGLDYRRLSPAHGTASDIKFKNKADISSFIKCMEL